MGISDRNEGDVIRDASETTSTGVRVFSITLP